MDPLFRQLGISLLLGLLVGLQRQHVAPVGIVGMRTFALVTLLGTLAGIAAQTPPFGGWLLGVGALGVIVLAVVLHTRPGRDDHDRPGITTDVAMLVMYAVGALLAVEEMTAVAVAVGGTVAVLLQFKPELHGLTRRLGDEDLRAIMQFVLITCIILPVLPDEAIDPYGVVRPWNVWLMVVLIVGMSLTGYIVYKFFGESAGILAGGLLGGAVSSTATTVSFARTARAGTSAARAALVVILLASSVMYVRVLVEAAIVSREFAIRLALPIGLTFAATLLAGLWQWGRWRHSLGVAGEKQPSPLADTTDHANPTQLRPAIIFGLTYAVVLFGLAAAQDYFGPTGFYTVAALSGLTEVDALTLSTANIAQNDPYIMAEGWRAVLLGTLTNFFSKAVIAGALGGWAFLLRVGGWFAVPIATGLLLLATM